MSEKGQLQRVTATCADGEFAPITVVCRADHHVAGRVPVGSPIIAARTMMTPANTTWANEELTHSERMR
jgi:hypothetical protein